MVAPKVGRQATVFEFSFRAPAVHSSTGTASSLSLQLVGPRGSGCVAARSRALPAAAPGSKVHVSLGPAQLGGPWCVGGWTARAVELQRAVCPTGQMCPQFIRVVPVAGPARFRVAR